MRIKLQKGKQKELILLAKGSDSWNDLAEKTNCNSHYLSTDLKNENKLLSDESYNKLCDFANKNFDKFIVERYDDNWGRSKGGSKSKGSTKKIKIPEKNSKLAEFIGSVLGDGNINSYKKGKKVGVYQIKIAGDYSEDREYHQEYLKPLCEELFGLSIGENVVPKRNERFLVLSSKELVEFFTKLGLKPGNKIKNQTTIPPWIWENDEFIKACLRGLIDTDGSIFRMSKRDPNLIRISFTNHNAQLLEDTRNAFISVGFNPSKTILNRTFYISRQGEIRKYLKEVGFSNKKHLKRYLLFSSPMV